MLADCANVLQIALPQASGFESRLGANKINPGREHIAHIKTHG